MGRHAFYSNGRGESGRGERSHADTDDLNVPLALTCELVGRERWNHIAS